MNSSIINCVKQKLFSKAKIQSMFSRFKYFTQEMGGPGPLNIPLKNENITIKELTKQAVAKMGLLNYGYSLGLPDRSTLKHLMPDKQEELPTRTMRDSYTTAIIPLSTDMAVQDTYIGRLGWVRNGRLLEDMDMFAVMCVLNHIYNPKLKVGIEAPYVVVTALVDTICFSTTPLNAQRDIRLKGHVSWVGRSSAEVIVALEQSDLTDTWHKRVRANFLLAVRDPSNTQAVVINRLGTETHEEKLILKMGDERREKRKNNIKSQSKDIFPTAEEQAFIHGMYKRTLNPSSLISIKLPKGAHWMTDAKLSTVFFCHPQNRNAYNKVFGGFLMRHASEQAWSLAYLYSKQYTISLIHMSDVKFIRPVEIGSILQLNAFVVYTFGNYLHVKVFIEELNPENKKENAEHKITNTFYFTFQAKCCVPEIFPKTYQDTMRYLEGKRMFDYVTQLKENIK